MKLNHARLTYSKLATSETKPNSLLKAILLSTMLAEKWNFHAAYVPTYFVLRTQADRHTTQSELKKLLK